MQSNLSGIVVVVALLGLVGCGSGSSKPEDATTTTAVVGAGGGTITTPATPAGKVSISIPAGALAADQVITVSLLDAAATADPVASDGAMLRAGGVAIELLPAGLNFAVPATVSVELPGAASPVVVGSFGGFSVGLGLAALTSADGTTVPLTNAAINVDPDTGTTTLSGQLSHFSRVTWNPFPGLGDDTPVTLDVLGLQPTLTVGQSIAVAVKASYAAGAFEQLHLSVTDQSVAPFNVIGGAGTFPLRPEFPQVNAYTCAAVAVGAFEAVVGVEVVSTATMEFPEDSGTIVPAVIIDGEPLPAELLPMEVRYGPAPVDCVAEDGGGGNQNAGDPQTSPFESVTGSAPVTVVPSGQTFTIITREQINPLLLSTPDTVSNLEVQVFVDGPVQFVAVRSIIGPGGQSIPGRFSATGLSAPNLTQEWEFLCLEGEAGTFDPLFEGRFLVQALAGGEILYERGAIFGSLGIRIECVPPTPVVSFAVIDFLSEEEGVGTVTVEVVSDIPAPQGLSIPFNTTGSTANEGPDFSFVPTGPVAIAQGATSGSFEISIVDDSLVEGTELVVLNLEPSPSGAYDLGNPSQLSLAINDNDFEPPIVSFEVVETLAGEAVGTVTIRVNTDIPAPQGLSIPFNTTGSSAFEGSDFTFAPAGPIAIAQGASTGTLEISIVDDSDVEGTELIFLNLEPSATGAYSIGTPSQTSLAIQDNDDAPPPTVGFEPISFSASEDAGVATFTVITDKPAPQAISISFNTDGSTAQEGLDYTFVGSDSIDIARGASSGSIQVSILDDSSEEGTETIVLNLELAALGDYVVSALFAQSTLSIEDNDDDGTSMEWNQTPESHEVATSEPYGAEGTVGADLSGSQSSWELALPDGVEGSTISLGIAGLFFPPLPESARSSAAQGTAASTSTIVVETTPSGSAELSVVVECLAETSGPMTLTVRDAVGTVVTTATTTVTCTPPPQSAACLAATTGLEIAYECDDGTLGGQPIADFFIPTVTDVPIGGGAGRTVPGGASLYLPATPSGHVPNAADFSASGWNGTLTPPPGTVVGTALFDLDPTHQYLFVQYESGVDLVDLATPEAAPVFTGLLNYAGREQVSEHHPGHDYMVMPVHGASGDYLTACGYDVVRHDYDPALNSGAGGFVADAERIYQGFIDFGFVCKDIWQDANASGVASGYGFSGDGLAVWREDGLPAQSLAGDWDTNGLTRKTTSAVGGFNGENILATTSGLSVGGAWFGPPGDAPAASVTNIKGNPGFDALRCVGPLCLGTSAQEMHAILWPDRSVAATVHEQTGVFASAQFLSARNMLEAANGNVYLLGVSSTRQLVIGRVTPEGDYGGSMRIDIASVCDDPQQAIALDMEHIGVLCRSDNAFKVLEFAPQAGL